jgi:ubiquinone/menaquinone biosynthesis C-methylase UbiE
VIVHVRPALQGDSASCAAELDRKLAHIAVVDGGDVTIFDWSTPIPNLFWEFYDRWVSPAVVAALQLDLHERLIRDVPRGSRLLDVGSGGGQHAVRIVQERPDLSVVGIDISSTMVKRSRELARRANVADKVTFDLGDATDLKLDSDSFDAVYCAGPLKQVRDKSRVLRECHRVLRPGGRLLAMDVNRGCSYEDVVDFVNRTPLPKPGRLLLKIYFSAYVARQSLDLDEARALWAELPLRDCDGPRRIPEHPAFVMVGTK